MVSGYPTTITVTERPPGPEHAPGRQALVDRGEAPSTLAE